MQPFQRPNRLEEMYRSEITKLLDAYFKFPTFATLGELQARLVEYGQATSFFEMLALRLASRMINRVQISNAVSWRHAAKSGSNGRLIYEMLRGNISGGTGLKISEIIHNNSHLIKSLPEKIAGTINHHIYMQFTQGIRSESIIEQIRPYMKHAKEYEIQRLARTEVSKADTAITQVRAQDIGLNWYVWKTSHDARVRKSHKLMNEVVVSWDEPPSPELLAGEKFESRYPAGGTYNCRCVALPVVRLEQLNFPIKIYYRGALHKMGLRQFAELSNLRKLAA